MTLEKRQLDTSSPLFGTDHSKKNDKRINSGRPLFRTDHSEERQKKNKPQVVCYVGLTTWKTENKPQVVRCVGLTTWKTEK